MSDNIDILQRIAAAAEDGLKLRKQLTPERVLFAEIAGQSAPKPFFSALKSGNSVRIIAELKQASPSRGLIRPDFRIAEFAQEYLEAGAAAISVLTEPYFFRGRLENLKKVVKTAAGTPVPVLRKDFLFDRYQITEARAAGADAVLLIAALIRSDALFAELLQYTHELGMEALCEAHDETEVRRLLALGARVIGVNSRDLRTFRTDIGRTGELLKMIPPECAAVAESGIRTSEDFSLLPADAYLIGETLMRAAHPGEKLKELRTGSTSCGR